MSDAHNHRASDRVRLELIEADVDMGFSSVDDARAENHEGNAEFAQAALEDADKVVMDIEDRLSKLDARTFSRGASEGDSRRASRVRSASRSILPSRRLVVSFFLTLSPIRKAHVRQRRT